MNDMMIETTAERSVMMVPLHQIRPDPDNVRTVADEASDDALRQSIQAVGVQVPIVVRPDPDEEGADYIIVYGARRYEQSKAAGLDSIPAIIDESMTPDRAKMAQVLENMQRADMHPVDEWQAIVALEAAGYTIEEASRSLGITTREGQRLKLLGRMHFSVIDFLKEDNRARDLLARPESLAAVANAPPEVQAEAVKNARNVYTLVERCQKRRVSRATAIFDVETAGVVFEQDLFAEPGSDDEWTTADLDGFMKAQRAAVEDQIAKSKGRMMWAEADQYGHLKLPKGYTRIYHTEIPKKWKKDDDRAVFVRIDEGYNYGDVIEIVAKPIAKPASGSAAGGIRAEDHTPPPREPISKAGRDRIAHAKRKALADALIATIGDQFDIKRGSPKLLSLLLLALTGGNIEIRGDQGTSLTHTHLDDLPARLVAGDGSLRDDLDVDDVRALAVDVISRVVVFPSPNRSGTHSGPVGEWIGKAIDADAALERLDTPDFLSEVNGDTLRTVALTVGEKTTGPVKGLRERLAGKLPDWKPAPFGAPGPNPKILAYSPGSEDDDGEDDEDALPPYDEDGAEPADGDAS